MLDRGYPVAELVDDLLEADRLHEAGARARIAEYPLGLLSRGCLVDRHGDRASGPDRVVDQGPLVRGMRYQRDPVASTDPGGDQPLGERDDLVGELARGHVDPLPGQAVRTGPAQHYRPRLLVRPAEDDIGEIRGR